MRRDTEELIAAYVDGVAELTPEERKRVEQRIARDPDARAEAESVRSLLDRLRELPHEGTEPDWAAMERTIGNMVGREVPRPWWRNWKWVAPIATFAAATAVLLATWSQRDDRVATMPPLPVIDHHAQPTTAPAPEMVPLWLDGDVVDVEASPDTVGAIESIEGELGIQDDALSEGAGVDGAGDGAALLPSGDLAWLDGLDDAALDRAEQWLAQRKKG